MKFVSLVVVVVSGVLAATALPFFPGRYDVLAAPLSMAVRAMSFVSLLLVPIGVAWLIHESRASAERPCRRRFGLVVTGLVVASLAMLLGALVAAMSSFVLSVGMLLVWAMIVWNGRRLPERARRQPGRMFSVGLVLILAPLVVVGAQLAFARILTDFAWRRTMDEMEPLIADIEQFRAKDGHYPRSLFSEWMDYRPRMIGVRGYQYEADGDTYRLAVEVPTFSIDSIEYLVYSPTDTHKMASHDADLLRRTADELPFYRGYSSARPVDRPHWMVLSFD